MAVADPYRVLQVLATADQEVLNAAFRALARKYHPDHDKSALAARRMTELYRDLLPHIRLVPQRMASSE